MGGGLLEYLEFWLPASFVALFSLAPIPSPSTQRLCTSAGTWYWAFVDEHDMNVGKGGLMVCAGGGGEAATAFGINEDMAGSISNERVEPAEVRMLGAGIPFNGDELRCDGRVKTIS